MEADHTYLSIRVYSNGGDLTLECNGDIGTMADNLELWALVVEVVGDGMMQMNRAIAERQALNN